MLAYDTSVKHLPTTLAFDAVRPHTASRLAPPLSPTAPAAVPDACALSYPWHQSAFIQTHT
ncbi:hypothetical protein TOT_020000138 [Theileria orientalis strain Shintoku]|uniref:Uncharacterized protein n=1 Tax=Theileria orientalis strain Shintoku TaxID=869250 RepID=J4C358_THEOR|nr:hypothetical protein TOT_020000138 [Theileria orientalis strain Shintoku]BAM39866.1 hypothetical protein TOT_020000138 [Theileria orientalis strain Shintoku]|eukprot:XP_009690167.1 hypothetical protein TOT_020000138 [Theileria orientalis strain Shintoku]